MNGLKVLIAGTSSSYLEISKKLLKFHYDNCEVEFAHSGHDCVEKVSRKPYDIILFDNDLDDKNGLDIIETIHKGNNRASLIIMIEQGEELKAARSIERGATDYIFKERGYLTTLPYTIQKILKNRTSKELNTGSRNLPRIKKQIAPPKTRGYFILDKKGRILSVNSMMEHLTSYSEDELLELMFTDFLPEEKINTFLEWLEIINENGNAASPLKIELFDKKGTRVPLKMTLTAIRDSQNNIMSYEGELFGMSGTPSLKDSGEVPIDQVDMINQVAKIITTSYDDSLNFFLERIIDIASQIFHFHRSTLALLDKRKKVYIKQAFVGYGQTPVHDKRNLEVPQEVVDRIFENRFRVKVIYYNQDHRDTSHFINATYPERRTQSRRPTSSWHPRDLVMLNLVNKAEQTFGYISLDKPTPGFFPSRDTFYNLELFGQLIAMAIENYYQFSEIEKHSRRLKQILVTSNIFKLYLSLNELLKEVVWSIRFSLDFKLVALGLISKRSGNLEIKAVACDDKVKTVHLLQQAFPLKALSRLLCPEHSSGKSYLVFKEEEVLRTFKQIYFGQKVIESSGGQWPAWGMILVPIKSREGKIVGVLMADDPGNKKIPGKENLRTLEIMANQISVAIDNRILYAKAKHKLNRMERNGGTAPSRINSDTSHGIKKIIDRLFN